MQLRLCARSHDFEAGRGEEALRFIREAGVVKC